MKTLSFLLICLSFIPTVYAQDFSSHHSDSRFQNREQSPFNNQRYRFRHDDFAGYRFEPHENSPYYPRYRYQDLPPARWDDDYYRCSSVRYRNNGALAGALTGALIGSQGDSNDIVLGTLAGATLGYTLSSDKCW